MTPEADTVSAVARKSFQVFGSDAPAFSKALALYQTRDLLAALKYTPYWVPSTAPRSCQTLE